MIRAVEEAQVRSLLLRELSRAGLGLRRLDSEDGARVRVTIQRMVAKRNDVALEQIVGPLGLELQMSGAIWQVDRSVHEA